MLKRILLFVFFFIFLASAVFAQEGNVQLMLKDVNTADVVGDIVVYVDIEGKEPLIRHVSSGGLLGLGLEEGAYMIELKADDPLTPAMDYFKKQSVNVAGSISNVVYLFPVGSLRGIVKDAFNNVVGNADLSFECRNDIGSSLPLKTNDFGSFMVEYMPIGSCKVFANFGEGVGFKEVDVEQGEITDVEILLDQTILKFPKRNQNVEIVVLLLFIAVVALLVYKYRKRIFKKGKKEHHEKKHEEKKEHAAPLKEAPKSSRAEDIKSTLNKKERDIVEFLTGKGETNQASVRHNTGIPRTSLSRVLASLEHKNVLSVRKVGKVVKIKLTDWFLGKE